MTPLPSRGVLDSPVDVTPDLSRPETRKRLTKSSIKGFFAVIDKWQISNRQAGELLGGVPRSTVQRWRSVADRWVTQPNDHLLFHRQAPLDYMVREGIPGLRQVRSLLDASSGGH